MKFFDSLTDQEKEMFVCLENVEAQTLWGISISNVVRNPDPMRFRRLICELKSQARDNEVVMTEILGRHCYQRLIEL